MLSQNLTVHGLWIGPRLSLMEQLTLRSFVACGHRFVLWLYGPLEHEVPPGVEVRDACTIVPRQRVFCYKAGIRPGSYAGFSDLFRYKLLYDCGGWWSDLDVVCLKPLDFDQWYAFHPHSDLGLVGSVLKCPPRSELMRCCALWTAENVDEWNVVWTRPIRILVHEARRLGLGQYILPAETALVDWRDGEMYATTNAPPPPGLHLLHWCNEWLHTRQFDKNAPIPGTTYHALLKCHGLIYASALCDPAWLVQAVTEAEQLDAASGDRVCLRPDGRLRRPSGRRKGWVSAGCLAVQPHSPPWQAGRGLSL